MFRKSRRKIVAAIMSVLILLFLGTLAVIYASSYHEVSKTNREMLERYVELYSLEAQPGEGRRPAGGHEPGGRQAGYGKARPGGYPCVPAVHILFRGALPKRRDACGGQ